MSRKGSGSSSNDILPFVSVEGTEDTLQFESRFESGNLQSAMQVGPHEYDLKISYDFNTNAHTQWFYFAIRNMKCGQEYKLNITNFYKTDSLYNWGLKPLVFSEARARFGDGVGWHRAGDKICYYNNKVKRHAAKAKAKAKPLFTLTFTLECLADNDTCYVAHCYPFTYSDLKRHLDELASDPWSALP